MLLKSVIPNTGKTQDTITDFTTKMEYRKHFIPLESNPDVFTDLIHKLGVSEKLCFQDVWSLENADELAFVPRPVYGLILVFPTTPSYEARVEEEDAGLEDYEGGGEGRVMFFKQTINNACGLYAIIHAVCNGLSNDQLSTASPHISPLHRLTQFSTRVHYC